MALVGQADLDGLEVGADQPSRRAGLFHFGNQADRTGRRKGREEIARRRRRGRQFAAWLIRCERLSRRRFPTISSRQFCPAPWAWRLSQCLKCRWPVKIIGIPCSFAGRDHFFVSAGTARLNDGRHPGRGRLLDRIGKRKERVRGQHAAAGRGPAFLIAISTESTRLICPAPTPNSALPWASTMAFDFTWRTIAQANRKSAICSALG